MKNNEVKSQALSSMGYFFLQMIFGMENHSESVLEELTWVVDEMASDDTDADLLSAIKQEFLEGTYAIGYEINCEKIKNNLSRFYDCTDKELECILTKLYRMLFGNTPLIVLIGRSGVGKTSVAEYLCHEYGWTQVESYTTRPKRTENEKGHLFISESEFNDIPGEDLVAYMEYRGFRYGATKTQLNRANLYVVDPGGYEMLKKVYHDRAMFSIKLTASRDVLEDRMRKRGNSEEEIADRLQKDDKIFNSFEADTEINTDNLTISEVGERIKNMIENGQELNDLLDSGEIQREGQYINVYVLNINWDLWPTEDLNTDLPDEVTISDHFLLVNYKKCDGSIDKEMLSEDVAEYLEDKYEYCVNEFDLDIMY